MSGSEAPQRPKCYAEVFATSVALDANIAGPTITRNITLDFQLDTTQHDSRNFQLPRPATRKWPCACADSFQSTYTTPMGSRKPSPRSRNACKWKDIGGSSSSVTSQRRVGKQETAKPSHKQD